MDIPIETVVKSEYNGLSGDARELVIRSGEEWTHFWNEYTGNCFVVDFVAAAKGNQSPEPAPHIDFSQYQVLVAYMGSMPCGGHSATITGVARDGDGLEAAVRYEYPDGMATMAITNPVHAVKVERTTGDVSFIVTESDS